MFASAGFQSHPSAGGWRGLGWDERPAILCPCSGRTQQVTAPLLKLSLVYEPGRMDCCRPSAVPPTPRCLCTLARPRQPVAQHPHTRGSAGLICAHLHETSKVMRLEKKI